MEQPNDNLCVKCPNSEVKNLKVDSCNTVFDTLDKIIPEAIHKDTDSIYVNMIYHLMVKYYLLIV